MKITNLSTVEAAEHWTTRTEVYFNRSIGAFSTWIYKHITANIFYTWFRYKKKSHNHNSFILLKYPTLWPLLWFRIGSRNCVKITDRTKCKYKVNWISRFTWRHCDNQNSNGEFTCAYLSYRFVYQAFLFYPFHPSHNSG